MKSICFILFYTNMYLYKIKIKISPCSLSFIITLSNKKIIKNYSVVIVSFVFEINFNLHNKIKLQNKKLNKKL